MTDTCDLVVVGAGLAGLAAARRCIESGLDVRILEARDRVGGRTYTQPFLGAHVDLGAEWVSPRQHLAVMAELARYGIELAPAPQAEVVTWAFASRQKVSPTVLDDDEEQELQAAYSAMESDAARIDFASPRWHESVLDLDIPLAEYLSRFALSPLTREYFLLHAFALMGADERRYSALHLLHEFAGFGSCREAFDGEADRIAGGAMSIAKAIAGDLPDSAVSFSTAATAVRQTDEFVDVQTEEGSIRGSTAIIAVPVNVLASIDLDVQLSPAALQVVSEGHAGAISKVWTRADGLPSPYMSAGWPQVPESYGIEAPRGQAVAAFQLVGGEGHAGATALALHTHRERHPDATFADVHQTHDWISDPHARGTWHTAAAGQAAGWYALAAHSGPCFFAGGDLSRRWVGWMDGALTSGNDAADRALAKLAGDPVPQVEG